MAVIDRRKRNRAQMDTIQHDKAPEQMLNAPSEDAQQPMGEEAPADVKAAHGPATEINIQHDHEGGRHHVHSKHSDGHEHQSEHGSAEEAHDHARELGTEGGEPDGDEQPMGDGDGDEGY